MKILTMGDLRKATANVPDEMRILLSTEGMYAEATEVEVIAPPPRFEKHWPKDMPFKAVSLSADY